MGRTFEREDDEDTGVEASWGHGSLSKNRLLDAHTKTEKAAVLARFPRPFARTGNVSPRRSAEMVRLTDYGCLLQA